MSSYAEHDGKQVSNMERVKLGDKHFVLYLPAARIDSLIDGMAERINRDYAHSQSLMLVGILNGAYMFAADLARKITVPCRITFMKVSSYEGLTSRGELTMQLPLCCSVEGCDVILLDEIVETGLTMNRLFDYMGAMGARSVAAATLLFKRGQYKGVAEIKYAALAMDEPLFVVGYGLDYNEEGRTLKDIYILDEDGDTNV